MSATTTTSTLPCKTARCALDAALHNAACAGQVFPGRVTAKLDRAVRLIENAQSATGKRQKHLLAKANRKLRLSRRAVHMMATRKKPALTAACSAALEQGGASIRGDLGS